MPEVRGFKSFSSGNDTSQKPKRAYPENQEAERFRLFEAVQAVLLKSTGASPLLLILEDCHAADEASLLLSKYLARELKQQKMVIVVTYRDAEVRSQTRIADLIEDLAREGRSITLGAFAEEEIGAFVELTAKSPSKRTIQALRRATEGNPLFLKEIVRLLSAQGQLESADSSLLENIRVPGQLKRVIRRRVELVSSPAQALLSVASVIGCQFDVQVLCNVMHISAEEAGSRIEEAIQCDLIVPMIGVDQFRFAHALFAEALREDLPIATRRELHLEIGATLENDSRESSTEYCSELAHHFYEALPVGNIQKAIDYLCRAAEKARASLASEDCINLYQKALQAVEFDRPSRAEIRCSILMDLAEAEHRVGRFSVSHEHFAEARQLAREAKNWRLFARAVLGVGLLPGTPGAVDYSFISQLEEALEQIGPVDTALRALVMGRLAEALQWSDQAERRNALAQEAIECSRRLDDRETLMDALYRTHVALSGPETVEVRLSASTELLQLTRVSKQPRAEMRARYMRIRDLLEVGDVPQVRIEVDAYAQLARQLQQQHVGITEAAFAMLALLDGRFNDAERLALEALNLGRNRPDGISVQAFATQIAAIRREQGTLLELEPMIRSYVEQFPALKFARCALAFCYSEGGRTEDARFHFDHFASGDFVGVPKDVSWLASMALLSEVCAALGDQINASKLLALLEPYESRNASLDMYVCYGPVAYYLGILSITVASFESAEKRFLKALSMTSKMDLRPWHAHAQHQYARLLMDPSNLLRDLSKALGMAENALITARSLGMKSLEGKLLRLTGAATNVHPSDYNKETLHDRPSKSTCLLCLEVTQETSSVSAFGERAWRDLLHRFHKIAHQQIRQMGAHEVEEHGNGLLAVFGEPTAAILAAFQTKSSLSRFGITVRAGVHSNPEIIAKASREIIQLAERVAAIAGPGEIILSSTDTNPVVGRRIRLRSDNALRLVGVDSTIYLFRVEVSSGN